MFTFLAQVVSATPIPCVDAAFPWSNAFVYCVIAIVLGIVALFKL